jgi:hypothetical protein
MVLSKLELVSRTQAAVYDWRERIVCHVGY